MLIFDCDGVLLDSEIIADRVVLEHLQNLLNSHGDKSLFSEQGSLREWLTDSSGKDDAGILKKFSMFTNIPLPTDSLKQLERNLKHALSKEVRAIKGMGELLKSIKGMWVVASNSSLSRLRISLGRAEMLDLCRSRLFSSEMVKRPKPAPDLNLYIATKFGIPVDDCVVIEDSPTGIRSALQAGMRVIGFTGGSHITPRHIEQLRQAGAIGIVKTADELSQLLENTL